MEPVAAGVWDMFPGVKDSVMMCHTSLFDTASPAQVDSPRGMEVVT